MNEIKFRIHTGRIMGRHSSVYVHDGDDLRERLAEEVIGTLSTDIDVTVGDVTMHLAAWMDPWHWESDWIKALGEDEPDVDAFLDRHQSQLAH